MHTRDEQLEIVALNETDWVIYDRREELSTGCGVLGFVTRIAGVYQVLTLATPAQPQFFSSFRSAIDTFADDAVFA